MRLEEDESFGLEAAQRFPQGRDRDPELGGEGFLVDERARFEGAVEDPPCDLLVDGLGLRAGLERDRASSERLGPAVVRAGQGVAGHMLGDRPGHALDLLDPQGTDEWLEDALGEGVGIARLGLPGVGRQIDGCTPCPEGADRADEVGP